MTLKHKPQFNSFDTYFDDRQASLFDRNVTERHAKIVELLDEIEKYTHLQQQAAQEQDGGSWTLWTSYRLSKLYGVRLRDAMLTIQMWMSTIRLMVDPNSDKLVPPLTILTASLESTQRRIAILMNQYEVFAVGEDLK